MCAEPGSVMARCCVAFESMKKFINVGTSENVNDLVKIPPRHAVFSSKLIKIGYRSK